MAFAGASVSGAPVLGCFTRIEKLLSTSFLSFLVAPLLAVFLENADLCVCVCVCVFFTCTHLAFLVADLFSSKCEIDEPNGNPGH